MKFFHQSAQVRNIPWSLRIKLERELPPKRFKVDLYLVEGTHQAEEEVTKQINDKERVAAAMENPHLRKTVEECIGDEE